MKKYSLLGLQGTITISQFDLSEKEIRRLAQERGWFFASSRDGGKSHIVTERVGRHHGYTVCGADIETTAFRKATNLCLKCRKKS